MKKLKMKSLKINLLLILFLLVISGIMFWQSLPALFLVIQGPQDLWEVDYSGDIEGLYVSGELPFIYDYYCDEVNDKEDIKAREYIIDGGEYYYIGMRVMEKDMDQAEALMEACYDYVDGAGSEDAILSSQYRVTGTIHAMPSDILALYYDYLDMASLSAEEQATFLPYYLEVDKIGTTDTAGMIIFLVLGVLLLALALLLLVWSLTGRYQKSIKRYLAGSPNSQAALEKVESFLANVPSVHGLQYNYDFICGQNGATTAFGETSKLVWAYQHTTTHKRYFITVGKTHSLVLAFADGSRQNVAVKRENFVQEHLQTLSSLCPRAIIGYSPELNTMFLKDFARFLSLKYYAAPDQFTAQEPDSSQPM